MKPIWKRVVLKELTEDMTTTESGIIVQSSEVPDAVGLVVEVGDAVEFVRPGDKVLYNKNTAIGFRHKGYDYKVIHEEGVYVILDRKEL